jgi:glutamine amidotransferase-like uncharacterized protein
MKKVGLFINHPECSQDCCLAISAILSSKYEVQVFDINELAGELNLNQFYCVIFPGGIGDSNSYHHLFKRKVANKVADYVFWGGRYLGICMGAYWAAPRYFDIVNDMDVVQYIKRDNAEIKRSYATTAKVNWKGSEQDMFFYDGCAIIGDESKFDVIARYANGDPMAIIQRRVGLIGCHPESMKYWYEEPWQYLESKWHDYRHHQLLIEFVDDLISRNC